MLSFISQYICLLPPLGPMRVFILTLCYGVVSFHCTQYYFPFFNPYCNFAFEYFATSPDHCCISLRILSRKFLLQPPLPLCYFQHHYPSLVQPVFQLQPPSSLMHATFQKFQISPSKKNPHHSSSTLPWLHPPSPGSCLGYSYHYHFLPRVLEGGILSSLCTSGGHYFFLSLGSFLGNRRIKFLSWPRLECQRPTIM